MFPGCAHVRTEDVLLNAFVMMDCNEGEQSAAFYNMLYSVTRLRVEHEI